MTEYEKLVRDYNEFEYWFDTYGYVDTFDGRSEGFETFRKSLLDPEYREQTIERLEEIAEEYEDYADEALELAERFRELELTTA